MNNNFNRFQIPRIRTGIDINGLSGIINTALPQINKAEPAPMMASDYNDPKAINSFADAIMTTFDTTMKRTDLGGLEKVPLLNIITSALVDVVWDKELKPVFTGAAQSFQEQNWDAFGKSLSIAGLNTLTNFSETMDIAANPVKGFLMEGVEGLTKALDLNGQGRTNYDWDIKTGMGGVADFAANSVAEILTDPLNWISFGGKAIIKKGIEVTADAAKVAAKQAVSSAVGEASEEMVDTLISRTVREYAEQGAKKTAFHDLLQNAVDDVARTGMRTIKEGKLLQYTMDDATKNLLDQTINVLKMQQTSTVLSGVEKLVTVSSGFEDALRDSVLKTSLPGWTAIGIKTIASKSWNAIASFNLAQRAMKEVVPPASRVLVEIPDSAVKLNKRLDVLSVGFDAAHISEDERLQALLTMQFTNTFSNIHRELDDIVNDTNTLPQDIEHAIVTYFNLQHTFGKNVSSIEDALENLKGLRESLDYDVPAFDDFALSLSEMQTFARKSKEFAEEAKGFYKQNDRIRALNDSVHNAEQLRRLFETNPTAMDTFIGQMFSMPQTKAFGAVLQKIKESAKHPWSYDEAKQIMHDMRAYSRSAIAEMQGNITAFKLRVEQVRPKLDDLKTSFNKAGSNLSTSKYKSLAPQVDRSIADAPLSQNISATVTALFEFLDGNSSNRDFGYYIAATSDELNQLLQKQTPVTYADIEVVHNILTQLYKAGVKKMDTAADATELQRIVSSITELINRLEIVTDYKEVFDAMHPIGLKDTPTNLKDLAENVFYRVQMSKYAVLSDLLDHESIVKLASPETLGLLDSALTEAIHNANPDLTQSLRDIKTLAQSLYDYRTLITTLKSSPELTRAFDEKEQGDIITTILDVLQTYRDRPLIRFQDAGFVQYYLDKVINSIQDQAYAINMTGKGDIKNIIQKYKLEDKLGFSIADLHAAGNDVIATSVIAEEVLHLKTDPDKFYAVLDIETTGKNMYQDNIHEIALLPYGTRESKTYSAYTNITPDVEVLHLVFPEIDPLDRAALEAAWKSRKADYLDETALLRAVSQDLQQMAGGKEIVFVMHNGISFDAPFVQQKLKYILSRMQDGAALPQTAAQQPWFTQYDDFTWLNGVLNYDANRGNIIDTLLQIKEKNGYKILRPDAIGVVKNTLTDFITRRLSRLRYGDTRQKFLASINVFTIRDLQSTATGINKLFPQAGVFTELADNLSQTADHFTEVLKDVKAFNTEQTWNWIPRSQFDEYSEDMDTFNAVQFVQKADPRYAVRKVMNASLIAQYYDADQLHYTPEQFNKLFRFVERLNQSENNILNIQEIRPATKLVLRQIFDIAKKTPDLLSMDGGLRYTHFLLDVEQIANPRRQIAIAQMILNDLRDLKDIVTAGKGLLLNIPISYQEIQSLSDVLRPFIEGAHSVLRNVQKTYDLNLPSSFWQTASELEAYRALSYDIADQAEIINKFADATGHYGTPSKAAVVLQKRIIDPMRQSLSTLCYALQNDSVQAQANLLNFSSAIAQAQFEYVTKLSNEDLIKFVWQRSKGLLIMSPEQLRLPQKLSDQYEYFRSAMLQNPVEGLVAIELPQNGIAIGVTAELAKSFGKFSVPEVLTKTFRPDEKYFNKSIHTEITNMMDMLDTVSQGRSRGSGYERFTESAYQELLDSLPSAFKDKLLSIDDLKQLRAFSNTDFDFSYMGDLSVKAERYNYASPSIFHAELRSANHMLNAADAMLKYRSMIFDKASIYRCVNIFEGLSTNDILERWGNSNDYVVAMLREDPKYLAGSVLDTVPLNKYTLSAIRTSNAILVPTSMYSEMSQIMNRFEITDPFVKFLSKVIVSPLKAGYLFSLGWVMRNFIDSNIKNIITNESLGDTVVSTLAASRVYKEYMELLQRGIDLSPSDWLTREGIQNLSDEIQDPGKMELFRMVHAFMQSSASGGQAQAILNAAVKTRSTIGKDWMDTFNEKMGELIWDKAGHLIKTSNEHIEQICRLSMFLNSIRKGATFSEALNRVLETHFNFNNVSRAQMYAELVLPFAGFTIQNFKYWTDKLSSVPWLASIVRDVTTPLFNRDEYNQYEVSTNRSLQYNILQGNMIMDDNSTLKIGSSLIDMYNMLLDPAGTVEGRILSPVRIPLTGVLSYMDADEKKHWTALDWTRNLLDNVPVLGPEFQRYVSLDDAYYQGSALKAYQRSKNIMTMITPSIIGGVQRQYAFTFDTSKIVYTTYDAAKYAQFIKDGARPVETEADLPSGSTIRPAYQPYEYHKKYYAKKIYPRRSYARRRKLRKVYHKRSYPKKRAYFRGTYVPPAYRSNVFNKIMRAAKGRTIRMPSVYRNPYVSLGNYFKIFTGTGSDRFKSRLLPVSTQTIKYKILQDWHYLR